MTEEAGAPWVGLAPRARFLFHLQALVRLALFQLPSTAALVALGVATIGAAPSFAVGGLLAVVQLVSALWMPTLSFDRWRWRVRELDLEVERGVWVRRATSVPLCRIQHVDVQQGVFEQWLGLARVAVHTASGLGADGVIPGLEHDDALDLRDALVARGDGDDGV